MNQKNLIKTLQAMKNNKFSVLQVVCIYSFPSAEDSSIFFMFQYFNLRVAYAVIKSMNFATAERFTKLSTSPVIKRSASDFSSPVKKRMSLFGPSSKTTEPTKSHSPFLSQSQPSTLLSTAKLETLFATEVLPSNLKNNIVGLQGTEEIRVKESVDIVDSTDPKGKKPMKIFSKRK